MLRESYIAFAFLILSSNLLLRSGLVDAYTYKMTNRQQHEFLNYCLKRKNWWFRILLPWRRMKDCHAPWHMQLFQIMRRVNFLVVALVGVLYLLSEGKYSLTLTCYGIMAMYMLMYYVPFIVYVCYLTRPNKGRWRGLNFDKVKRK